MQERGGTQHKFEKQKRIGVHYSHNKKNIGNLKATKGVDVVLTSPPYASGGWKADENPENPIKRESKRRKLFPMRPPDNRFSADPKNIQNLHYPDVDAVLTSPPYAHEATASKPTRLEQQGLFKMGHSKETPLTDQNYRKWQLRGKGNIAKRKLFVRVPCSPKEATRHDTRLGRKGTEWEWTKEVKVGVDNMNVQEQKSDKKGKTETYLEAMLKVYRGMYDVLKPGGLCIIVLKNFIRHWKVVDLIGDTEKLCKHVGLKLVKRIKFELPHVSFWRLNYRSQWKRKFPDQPFPEKEFESVYRYETCLVFRKN